MGKRKAESGKTYAPALWGTPSNLEGERKDIRPRPMGHPL